MQEKRATEEELGGGGKFRKRGRNPAKHRTSAIQVITMRKRRWTKKGEGDDLNVTVAVAAAVTTTSTTFTTASDTDATILAVVVAVLVIVVAPFSSSPLGNVRFGRRLVIGGVSRDVTS